MATLGQIESKLARRAGRTLMLEPWVFADQWSNRPAAAVCVGLRLMSERDKSYARAEAEKIALELHPKAGPNWVDAFNDALFRLGAALGICDPNDVTAATAILPIAEDQVRQALTSRGARFIFEALERYEIETSPLAPPAEAADLDELGEGISSGKLDALPPGRKEAALRFLRYAVDELRAG